MLTTVDKFGRVIIPKKIRKRLGIGLGDTLNLSEEGQRIIIEPVSQENALILKQGILVFTGKMDREHMNNLTRIDRGKRIKKLLGGEGK